MEAFKISPQVEALSESRERIFSRVLLFSKRDEAINLIWPAVLFVVLAPIQLSFRKLSFETNETVLFLSGTLFLNVVHNAFSIFIIFMLPESRAWLLSFSGRRRGVLFAKWALLFIGLLFFFESGQRWLGLRYATYGAALFFTLAIGIISHYHHTILQIKGLAAAYNKILELNCSLDARTTMRYRECERRERLFFSGLLWISSLGYFEMLTLEKGPLLYLTAWVSAGFFLAIFVNSFYFPQSRRTLKPFYLLRVVFFPLSLVYPIMGLGIPFFHGIEYTFVFRKMWKKSSLSASDSKKFIWKIIVPASILTGLISLARTQRGFGAELAKFYPSYSSLIFAVAALSLAFNFLHFYLDREIFRMKDPNVRKNLGPLLT